MNPPAVTKSERAVLQPLVRQRDQVAASRRSAELLAALRDSRLIAVSWRQPFLYGARALRGAAFDPGAVLILRHAGREADALTATIRTAGKLYVASPAAGDHPLVANPASAYADGHRCHGATP
jgi:uncharacterized protein YbjT (DUF2867 family)